MAQPKTNFALLLGLLGARASDVVKEVGVDKSLVSRWMNGKQKLMPGHGWIDKVADYMLALDGRLRDPVIPHVLSAYYPAKALGSAQACRAALLNWLATVGHQSAQHQPDRAGLAGLILEKAARLAAPAPAPEPFQLLTPPPMKNAVVYGVEGVQGSALQFIDLILEQKQPQDILYACPEGLDMYTRDEKFGAALMDGMMEMFAAGHRLHVVLRTDYKMTDVSAFSGRWLVAHLLGYVQSHYFDEFHKTYKDKMMAVLKGKMAMKVTGSAKGGNGGVYTSIHFDAATVGAVWNEIESYRSRSKQRFHYRLFEQPDGFLCGVSPLPDRAHYQFARLPHFCVAGRDVFQNSFLLTGEEMALLEREFSPLLIPPEYYEPETPLRHIYCEDDIEAALLKSRHISQELSAITGRRVVMTTQALVNRLILLKQLLEAHKHFDICFLPGELFQKLRMQITAWGDVAAAGWIAGGKSTACRDYTNVNALTGFCESVWEKIPGVMKSRRTAMRKLNTWLKKAEKYGYAVRQE